LFQAVAHFSFPSAVNQGHPRAQPQEDAGVESDASCACGTEKNGATKVVGLHDATRLGGALSKSLSVNKISVV